MKKLKIKKFAVIIIGIIITVFIVSFVYFEYRPDKPNILLITVDALRPDHLGCYGYKRNTSPNIDRLAKEGTVFLNCFATSSATAFSSPALFTGRYLEICDENEFADNVLDKKFTTLAEYLKSFGYYTAAFPSANSHYRAGTGYEQGFDYYNPISENQTTALLNFLNNYQGNKPLFIWIHYMDVHAPYLSPDEYLKVFENDNLWKKKDKKLKVQSRKNINSHRSEAFIPKFVFHKDRYSFNYYTACYDAEIAYTDFHIGRLLKNIPDNTLIILSADHGESLGEHNVYFSHGGNIYDEVLHIPLIVRDSKHFKDRKKILKAVSSVDIVPAILSRINPIWYIFSKHKFNGRNLKRLVHGKDYKKREYIYSYSQGEWSIRDINRNIKYILYQGGREELYFLPDEYKNLIKDDSSKVISIREELKENLELWLKHYPIRSDINAKKVLLNEQAKDNLRSLGYLQ